MDFPPRNLPDLAPVYQPQLELSHAVNHNDFPAQQPYGLYGVDQTSAFTPQVQFSGGQVATMQNPDLHLFSLSTAHSSHAQFNMGFAGNSQSASVSASTAPTPPPSPMGPPAQLRKCKAATLRAVDWEPYKDRILDLHIVQNLSLPKVRKMIEEAYGFKAELRQYRTRISQWGKDKNVKPREMEAIVRKRQNRKLLEPNKGPLMFEVRGGQVEPQKIKRWMKRHDVAESFLYAPSPAASTPSAVGCHTISERGSPAAISAYSPAVSVLSPRGIYLAAQNPQMPSPALSVSSILRPQTSTFAGQSPAMAHQSLVELQPSFVHDLSTLESEMYVDAPARYRAEEETRLCDQIRRAEIFFMSSSSETLGMRYELGSVLLDQGRYRAAEDVIRRLVESYKSQNSNIDDDIEMLKALHLLGRVLNYQGLYTKAERLLRRSMQGRKGVLGEEHPDTLTSMANLATTYSKQGRGKEAEELFMRVMETRKRVLGEDHSDTLRSMGNLASTYRNQGWWKEAEELEVQVMEMFKRVLGEDHPDTLRSMGNLASTYRNQGLWREAKELGVQVMEARKRVLGEDHPDTLTSMAILALTYWNQGRGKEAKELFMQVMETRKRVLGEDHPDTLRSMGNLASTYRNQGWWKEAEELEVQVMEMFKRVLGEDHPDTLRSMGNLASTYRNQGLWREAEELEAQVMETRKRVLGEDHPDTLRSKANLAFTLKDQGLTYRAISLMEDCFRLQTVVLGPQHPFTISSRNTLATWQF
ncbi:Tetratricopeptide repeat-domain-containing protein [Clohesyomyces aquaticus]|uniref:Tetratricopeptide repeat-domain-containing protein n=1 Tax=Clohesyomyces aquaticus TaxID=1231657 RepID=A0A1Y2A691_9PLEO|nr:Tetratricopeptide repeat-domain-containing protein [Clohesyomyces aquaticus]